jgi:DNA-binding transcriptional LysR family regulator
MDQLRSIQIFIRAFELGGFSSVARDLNTTQPTISKAVAALEKELGVRLFERTTTNLTPTEQGKRFYARAKGVLEEYGEAVADVRGLTETPAGFLRVNAPVGFGQFKLNALLLEFMEKYPEIDLELILNDRFVDLVEEGVDVALRLDGTLPQNAIARGIALSPRYLVASPAYLEACPRIRHPNDLVRHQIIRFAWLTNGDLLELERAGEKISIAASGRYRVNNALAIRESFALGVGLGLAPEWLVEDLITGGQLLRVLPAWHASTQRLSLLYPSRRYQPLRARLLIQFLAERIPRIPGFRPWSEPIRAV